MVPSFFRTEYGTLYPHAARRSHPYATRYGRVGPVLPIGLLNHNLSFFLFLLFGIPTRYRTSLNLEVVYEPDTVSS